MQRSFVWSALLSFLAATLSWAADESVIRHSDVVFMYDNPELYETYGCTVVGWAGRPDRDHIRRAHDKGVRLFCSSIGFLTEFRRVIDFSDQFMDAACRNFAGDPYIVPWLWDHEYKGQKAWWWCTNSPLYQDYLYNRLEQVIAAGPDGLHIDDYRGTSGSVTWLSGGFCSHCMEAFRKWLKENIPREELRQLNITDLDSFDYGVYLRQRGVTVEQYKKERWRLPLADYFYRFHVEAATKFVDQFHRRAEEIAGRKVPLAVNSGLSNAQALVIAPYVDFFCCEVDHAATSLKMPLHPVYVYKLGDALDRPIASTASGRDWHFVAEHKLEGLVRTWIALSYAFGHNFMAPHRQWCYWPDVGTHWYSGPTEEYAYVYQFVRKHGHLLDGYESRAMVAVVYCNTARRKYQGDIEPACHWLAEHNIPFDIVIAGDDWLPYRLDAEKLKVYKAVIVPEKMYLDREQEAVLEQVAATGRLVRWPNTESIQKLVGKPIRTSLDGRVLISVRHHRSDQGRPAVVHIINRQYAPGRDDCLPIENLTLTIDRTVFTNGDFRTATIYRPDRGPNKVPVKLDDQSYTVTVPGVGFWAIVAFE